MNMPRKERFGDSAVLGAEPGSLTLEGKRSGSVNIRLTQTRRLRLEALAKRCGHALSPSEAIDRALELADEREHHQSIQSAGEGAEALAGLRREVAAMSRESQERGVDHARRLAAIGADVARLAALIAAASGDPAEDMGGMDDRGRPLESSPPSPMPLREWLDSQPLEESGRHGAAVAALATWLACRRVGAGRNIVELRVKRSGPGESHALVLLGPIDDNHTLARPYGKPLASICQRRENGWFVTAREFAADGALGPTVAATSQ